MSIEIRIIGPGDEDVLSNVAADVFDEDVDQTFTTEFLDDARHHLAVALNGSQVVGFASAVHYLHPDKPTELWINEVGVSPDFQRQGLGTRLMRALFDMARETLGCNEAWVLTEPDNIQAHGLYRALGGEPDPTVMFSFKLDE